LILTARFGAGRVLRGCVLRFGAGCVLRFGSGCALRIGSGCASADGLRLRVMDRLGLRIADRLSLHLMQFSLGRCGRLCHFTTISLSTSRLP
jgi:hypothetical protein